MKGQFRGVQRNSKLGLGETPKAGEAPSRKRRSLDQRLDDLQDRTLRYLEKEADILLASPGNAREVMQLARTIEQLRASRSGEAAPPSIRDEFDMGAF